MDTRGPLHRQLMLATAAVIAIAAGALVLRAQGAMARSVAGANVGLTPTPTVGVSVAADTGPETFVVGEPSLVNGEVVFAVSSHGVPARPYSGFSLHVTWDPAAFALARATSDGGLFDQETGGDHGTLCLGPTDLLDLDGGGFVLSCSFVGAHSTDAAGVLVTVTLKPKTGACSAIHIETIGLPDNGNSTSGTYVIDASQDQPEVSQYRDGSANGRGVPCAPGTN